MAKPKEIRGLDCAGAAGEGFRLVLFSRFEEMLEYRGAALAESDVEGVHDMRVASRRLRSALRDYRPHLRRGKRLEAARAALRRLANALGAVRDEDVAIGALEKLKEAAPPEAVVGVEEYAAERRARREEARVRLTDVLSEEQVAEARRVLAHALEEKGKGRGAGEGGGPSFEEGQGVVVRLLWRELSELAPSLHRPRKARKLHEMRIAAKRLRYALELLDHCRADGAPKALASEVADLQGALGDLHDCDVWAGDLGGQLSGAGLSAERRVAAVWLLGHFVEQRAGHYRAALSLWHEWERGGFADKVSR